MHRAPRSFWAKVGRVFLIIAVGAALIFLDNSGFHPPTPPAWGLVWAGWIISGISLFFGGELLQGLRAASREKSESDSPEPANQHR